MNIFPTAVGIFNMSWKKERFYSIWENFYRCLFKIVINLSSFLDEKENKDLVLKRKKELSCLGFDVASDGEISSDDDHTQFVFFWPIHVPVINDGYCKNEENNNNNTKSLKNVLCHIHKNKDKKKLSPPLSDTMTSKLIFILRHCSTIFCKESPMSCIPYPIQNAYVPFAYSLSYTNVYEKGKCEKKIEMKKRINVINENNSRPVLRKRIPYINLNNDKAEMMVEKEKSIQRKREMLVRDAKEKVERNGEEKNNAEKIDKKRCFKKSKILDWRFF
jgi:hypothetical protein